MAGETGMAGAGMTFAGGLFTIIAGMAVIVGIILLFVLAFVVMNWGTLSKVLMFIIAAWLVNKFVFKGR